MDRFSKENSCTICHDYGSSECGCPTDTQAEIARLQAEVDAVKEARDMMGRLWQSARNDALKEAEELAAEYWREMHNPDQRGPVAAAIRAKREEIK